MPTDKALRNPDLNPAHGTEQFMNALGVSSISELRQLYGPLPEQSLARPASSRVHRAVAVRRDRVGKSRRRAGRVAAGGSARFCRGARRSHDRAARSARQQEADDIDERLGKCRGEPDLLCPGPHRVAARQRPGTDHDGAGCAGTASRIRQAAANRPGRRRRARVAALRACVDPLAPVGAGFLPVGGCTAQPCRLEHTRGKSR